MSIIKHLAIIALFLLTTFITTSCDKETDDIIPEPTETSTILTGYITTVNGTPLANIPVSADFTTNGLFGSTVVHKAKGTTDKSGHYKIFFETKNDKDAGMSNRYTFSVDFSVLPSDLYVVAQKAEYSLSAYRDKLSGSTITCNFTMPRKKLLKSVVINNGQLVKGGTYAVKNVFPFFESDDDLHDISNIWDGDGHGNWRIFENIDVAQNGSTSLMLPCAVGVENTIRLVYLGNDTVTFIDGYPASKEIILEPTDKSNDEMEFNYFVPDTFK